MAVCMFSCMALVVELVQGRRYWMIIMTMIGMAKSMIMVYSYFTKIIINCCIVYCFLPGSIDINHM